jgi:hypothetical protein
MQTGEISSPATVVLHANSPVLLRILETLTSDTSTAGMKFKLEVTDDIAVDTTVVIPAGSEAIGEVIHAAKAGMLGKAGELSISARYVTVGDRRIKLRAALGSAGQSRTNVAMFVPFVRGKQLVVPVGTELIAKVAADEIFTAAPAAD